MHRDYQTYLVRKVWTYITTLTLIMGSVLRKWPIENIQFHLLIYLSKFTNKFKQNERQKNPMLSKHFQNLIEKS